MNNFFQNITGRAGQQQLQQQYQQQLQQQQQKGPSYYQEYISIYSDFEFIQVISVEGKILTKEIRSSFQPLHLTNYII